MLKQISKLILPARFRLFLRKLERFLTYRLFNIIYFFWIFKYDLIKYKDQKSILIEIQKLTYHPFFSVIFLDETSKKKIGITHNSLKKQLYSNWEIIIEKNQEIALKQAKGEFICFLKGGERLSADAFYQAAKVLNRSENADLIYSDSDNINHFKLRSTPYFKTDWDPFLFLSQDYLQPFCVVRKSLLDFISLLKDYNLLRLVQQAKKIIHIPLILCHVPGSFFITPFSSKVGPPKQIEFSLPTKLPFVSIIIPTKDQSKMLACCITSLFAKTKLRNFEVIIINNQSEDIQTFEYFEKIKSEFIRILDYNYPFNYSAINNFAVNHAKGEFLLFLNNDTEVISQNWLENMLNLALQPDVGIVGAKLYYPDQTLQHAGLILNLRGLVSHAYSFLEAHHPGYFHKLQTIHSVSCVTGACLMMRKNLFDQLGGFDENAFVVTFNDIDLCIKVRESGYRILFTPFVELYHKESATRGFDNKPAKMVRYQKEKTEMQLKWGKVLFEDPYYNPNLSIRLEYSLAFPPRINRLGFKKD